MTTTLLILCAILGVIGAVCYQFWLARRTIEQLSKTNASLEQTKQKQAVEIQTKNVEIKNAQIQRKNSQSVKRSNATDVDQQLQQHGWFRAEDSGHGVPSVSPDLPKPSRHGGDQAADTDSQSHSSGDLQ